MSEQIKLTLSGLRRPDQLLFSSSFFFVAVFAVVTTIGATTTPLAYARTSHVYEPGSAIREVPVTGPGGPVEKPGPLQEVNSMSLYLGNLYVAEGLEEPVLGGISRTDEWTPSVPGSSKYEFTSQLKQSEPTKRWDRGIAFGMSAGETEMYIGQEAGPASIDVLSVGLCGTLECTSLQTKWTGAEVPGGSFSGRVTGVAVDHSTGTEESAGDWASGDVFVDDTFGHVIDIFEPQAGGKEKYVKQITGPSPTEHFGEVESLAVSGFNGDLVAAEGSKVYLFRPEKEGSKTGKYVFVQLLKPPSGTISEVNAVAVDDSTGGTYRGEIYVATSTAIYEFGPEGSFRGEITAIPKDGAPGFVDGELGEEPFTNDFARPVSIAVDPTDHLVIVGLYDFEAKPKNAVVDVFGSDVVIPDVVTEEPVDLELSTDGGSGAHSWGILPTGTVNPHEAGEASCWFVWGISTQSLGKVASCEENTVLPEGKVNEPVRVNASLSGLEPDTTYYYRLQAKNANGTNPGEESQDYEFTTPGPGLRDESVSDVSSSSATLNATIAPHEAPEYTHEEHRQDLQEPTKSPATYYFQYSRQSTAGCGANPSVCANVPLSAASVGSDAAGVEVEQHVQGLLPGTTYHYRVVAANEALPEVQPGVMIAFYGSDQTFTTQGAGRPLVLPDGRAWEVVSPVDKRGATVQPISEGVVQSAEGGGAFTYLTTTPTEAEPRGYGGLVQVLSSRGAAGEWSSVDIGLSHAKPVGAVIGIGHEYRFFSEDLGLGVAESLGPFSVPEGWHLKNGKWERVVEVSPVPNERTPYLRHDLTCQTEPATCYEPLLSEEDVTSKAKVEGNPESDTGAASAVGATPSANDVVVSSEVQLTDELAPKGGLYEWSADKPATERLSLVSLLPEGEGGEAASAARLDEPHGTLASVGRRMIANNGSRVFFSALAPGQHSEHLYLRDMLRGETVRLDSEVSGDQQSPAIFQIASADGSKAFFTDSVRLTGGSGVTGSDLYECDFVEEAGKLKCGLTDLTPVPAVGRPGAGESARVLGVLGASEDGTYVYFVASGVLTAGAGPGDNLYVAHREAGEWAISFIRTLSGDDFPDWVGGTFKDLGRMTSRVSPDGAWLAFMSDRSLTGYDNRDAKSWMLDEEVYLYDAATGSVVCASCNPSGARPVGVEYDKLNDRLVGGDRVWSDGQWLAANVPGWTSYTSNLALYQSRFLSDNGRLFFDSSDGLVSQDTNGNEDVYEYEPVGVGGGGGCMESSSTFSAVSMGCVGLVSSGVASGESAFLDASGSGGDVFFLTKERLVPRDVDTALDVYDAHECTGVSPCASPVPPPPGACESAASCRAAPLSQPSLYGAPSSATFAGVGNIGSGGFPPSVGETAEQIRLKKLAKALRACRKKRVKSRRVACERKVRFRYRPVKAAKAGVRSSSRKSAGRGRRG